MTNTLNLLIARSPIIDGQCIHDDRTCAECTALRTFGTHRFDHTGDHDLQTTARTTGRDIDVYASVAVRRGNDPFPVQDCPTREFFNFLNGVEDTASDILKWGFDSCRRLATMRLPILVTQLLNENGFGSRAATVSGENDAEVLGRHAMKGNV